MWIDPTGKLYYCELKEVLLWIVSQKHAYALVVLLLADIALRPLVFVHPVRATQSYEYNAFGTTGLKAPDDMNVVASTGWEVIAFTYSGPGLGYLVTIRKTK
jgi:hypothetical protein